MGHLSLSMVIVAVLLGGCARKGESPAPPPPVVPSEGRQYDDFNLPLVIQLDVPEVPPEIERPLPPIAEEPKPP